MSEQTNNETNPRLLTADLLDVMQEILNHDSQNAVGDCKLPSYLREKATTAFNAAQKQWSNEAKAAKPATFECILCHFTYRTEAGRDKCFAQHQHAIETSLDDQADDLPVFRFHLPAHDHDEVTVKSKDLPTAREMLYDWVAYGRDCDGIVVESENIDDGCARYWKEEVMDANVFDSDHNQIDN